MSDYSIDIDARLQTQQFEKDIQSLATKKREVITKVKVDTDSIYTGLKKVETYVDNLGNKISKTFMQALTPDGKDWELQKTLTKQVNNIEKTNKALAQTSIEVKRYYDGQHRLVEKTTELNSENQKIVTTITTEKDAYGKLITNVDKYNFSTHQQLETSRHIVDDLATRIDKINEELELQKRLNTEESKTVAQTNTLVDGYHGLVTTTTEVNNEGQKTVTTLSEYTDEAGRVHRITEKVDGAGNKLQSTMHEVSEGTRKASQSFGDIVAKVTKFYLATLPIQTFKRALSEAISTVKEYDEALTEFKKVTDLSGESLNKYTIQLGELGATVGRTRTEMVQLATEMKKAGYSNEDAKTLAQITAYYQNTADEVLSTSEASAVLISQMKAFNMSAKDSMHILDAINIVSQDFAVSSGDIGKGLTQAGASLSTYGNTFEETIGLISSGSEIFQGKSQQVKSYLLLA